MLMLKLMRSKMFQTELENSCAAKPKLLDLFPNTQKVKEKGEEENTQKIKQFQSFHRGTMTAAVPIRYLLAAALKHFNQIIILKFFKNSAQHVSFACGLKEFQSDCIYLNLRLCLSSIFYIQNHSL